MTPHASAVVAYLYHDAASAEQADPLLHSTLLVLAHDRRPNCRNETPLVTLAQAEAMVAAERDCRTCRQFRGTLHCHSVLRCVDGSSYQRGGVVQLWEAAPVDAGF